ncbi:MAG: hypothetical protein H6609_09450 [Ignavibacteriales bacterium]|nr:hypothetical protein [Ignavibacteriales bacterium]
MIKLSLTLFVISILLVNCATHSYLDTAQFRDRDYNIDKISLTDNGLSQSEINSISSTKLPSNFPVDLSIILMKDYYIENTIEQVFLQNLVDSLKKSDKIERIMPIPRFLIPQTVSFSKVQELGIRSLTEYVVVFDLNSETLFKIEELINSKVEITSTIDFILVDSKTTAIIAADRLNSSIIYDSQIFKNTNRKKAQEEIFSEQGKIFAQIIKNIFNK